MSEVDGFKSKKRYRESSEKDNHCAIALESKGDTPTTKDTVTPQNVQQRASEMMREYVQPELFPESSLECPLCLKLLYDPVTLPCGHVFCKFCLERSMKEKAICPMCRENISYLNLKKLRANPTMVFLLEQIFGDTYRMRKKEVEQDREDYLNNEVVTKVFVIGNQYQYIGQRQVGLRMQSIHRWDLFVRMEDDSENIMNYVDRVQFIIHPSFKENNIICTKPPFTITRLGWGYFDARVVIHFRPEYGKPSLTVIHQLVFQDNGGFQLMETEFSKKTQAKIVAMAQQLEREHNRGADGVSHTIVIDEGAADGSGNRSGNASYSSCERNNRSISGTSNSTYNISHRGPIDLNEDDEYV